MINFLKSIKYKLKAAWYKKQISNKSMPEVFQFIYRRNIWKSQESCSGSGSEISSAAVLITELPAIFKQWNIKTMLDIPCGDFNWMQKVDLSGIHYTGADIVPEIVASNILKYGDTNTVFRQMDIVTNKISEFDLVFCRDCLVHLSNDLVLKALKNISSGGSKYFMATTFDQHTSNEDILTGEWRKINLQLPPFNLPKPIFLINEGIKKGDGDKCMGFWEVAGIE